MDSFARAIILVRLNERIQRLGKRILFFVREPDIMEPVVDCLGTLPVLLLPVSLPIPVSAHSGELLVKPKVSLATPGGSIQSLLMEHHSSATPAWSGGGGGHHHTNPGALLPPRRVGRVGIQARIHSHLLRLTHKFASFYKAPPRAFPPFRSPPKAFPIPIVEEIPLSLID